MSSQKLLRRNSSWLRCDHSEGGPESDQTWERTRWLARDNRETNPITITPPGLTDLAAVCTRTLFYKVFCFVSMYLSLDNSFPNVRCGDPRMKEQIKPRRVLECRNEKPDPYRPSLPHVVTINRFQQYNLSPLLPHREKVFASPFPLPSICASFNQRMTWKTPIPLPVPWV